MDDLYNNYILGAGFLRNFYTIFKYYNQQTIEFAVSSSAPAGTALGQSWWPYTPPPTPSPDDSGSGSSTSDPSSSSSGLGPWEIVLICVLSLVLVGIVVSCFIKDQRAKKRDSEFAEVQKMYNSRYSQQEKSRDERTERLTETLQ